MNQALHTPLSDIPEEGQDKTEKSGIGTKIVVKSCLQPNSQPEDDDVSSSDSNCNSDSDSDSDSDMDEIMENDHKPEFKNEYDDEQQKCTHMTLSIQNGSELPILSSSSSSQTELHLLTNTSLSDSFPGEPFGYDCNIQQNHRQHQYQQQQQQQQQQQRPLLPSSTGSSLIASSYESDYGSIVNIDNNSSMSISVEQSSSLDTSFDNSDAVSFTTVKIRNSNDSLTSSKHSDHHYNKSSKDHSRANDSKESTSLSPTTTTTDGKLCNHNPHTMQTKEHHQKPMTLSPRRKSRLNDLARAAQQQHKQRFPTVFNVSNKNKTNVSSESMPLSTSHRHHHHHEKYYTKNPSKRIESLHKMHTRQRRVSHIIGNLKGVEQSASFRDVRFSFLFFAQLSMMIFLALKYGPQAIGSAIQESPGAITPAGTALPTHAILKQEQILFTCQHVILLAACSGVISIIISTLALIFMTLIAEKLVEIALYLAISLALAWGTIGAIVLSAYSKVIPITGLALLGLITAYAFIAWDRIPFASANLKTALTAIRSRPAVVAVAFALQMLMSVWAILSMFTVVGIYNVFHHMVVDTKWKVACYVGLGVSFYWSVQLLLCMVHVTVAGVVKNWWFNETSLEHPPPMTQISSPSPLHSDESQPKQQQNKHEAVVMRSFQRAAFYSFGSVCFGSLLVTFVRMLRRIPKYIHPCSPTRNNSLQGRPMSGMDVLGLKFNRFAFIYVGMYGYNFIEAGERASALLTKRGWKKIVTDNLVSDVLLLVSLVIGGVSGCLTVWIESVGFSVITSSHPTSTSFLIGFGMGLVLSCIIFGIISSSVNAVILLFAANPVEFEENHPTLSHEMRAAWKEVFPGKVDFVETTNNSCPNLSQYSVYSEP